MTAAGRGREKRGGLALAWCLAPLCLRLCAHLLPKPPAPAPGPAAGPQSIPDSPNPVSVQRRQGAPCERPILATRRPLPRPRRDGTGAPGAMRGQGRKESLSDSRDLDGSYDQLTGESGAQGSREGA